MGRTPHFNIYKITHRETGKAYIGVTTYTVKYRWESHIRSVRRESVKSKTAITAAIAKYGPDAFDVVHTASALSKEDMLATERYLIVQEQTKAPLGYNLTDGGDRLANPAAEVRAKLALAAAGVIHSPETRAKMSASLRLRWKNGPRKTKEEYREIVRRAWEVRRANGNDTYIMPESTKAAISAAKKAYYAGKRVTPGQLGLFA